jgi:hypothetical protein
LQQIKHSRTLTEAAMFSTTTPLFHDTDSLLQEHALSAGSFHAACRDGYRWRGRALGWAEMIDGLLARRFVTTLLLVGVPALAVAILV